MAKKLDRSRDFGTIQGDDQGRMFEQDGVFFCGDGSAWAEPVAAAEPKKTGKGKATAAPAADSVDDGAVAGELDQVAAQLQAD